MKLFSVHTYCNDSRRPEFLFLFILQVIPMMRAIMLRRSQEAYETLFMYLKQLMPNFKPAVVKCDFEDAQFNAWRTIFDPVSVEGCLWHYDVVRFKLWF